jgi:hypothetical protein
MDEIEEAIDALEQIHPDAMIAIDETRYLHLGQLAVLCIKKLKELQDLQNDDTRH